MNSIGLTCTISVAVVCVVNAKFAFISTAATSVAIVIVLVTVTTITTLHTVRSIERKLISEAQLTVRLQNRAFEIKKIKKCSWTLVAIFFIFFVSFILDLCVVIILAASNSNIASKDQQVAIEAVLTILLTNSSVNPTVNCLRMKEIRQAVRKIVKPNNAHVASL